jgi:hypothetical protein
VLMERAFNLSRERLLARGGNGKRPCLAKTL